MSFHPSYFKKPPREYIENFVEYTPGFDTTPELIHFIMHGFTMREAQRMRDLIWIEALKHRLAEAKLGGDATPEEIEYLEAYIAENIEEYNCQGIESKAAHDGTSMFDRFEEMDNCAEDGLYLVPPSKEDFDVFAAHARERLALSYHESPAIPHYSELDNHGILAEHTPDDYPRYDFKKIKEFCRGSGKTLSDLTEEEKELFTSR